MAGYVRQALANIANGLTIFAADLNAEFNQLVAAFSGTTGHTHDASTGNGPKISLATSISGILPVSNGGTGGINKLDATTAPTVNEDFNDGYAVGSIWVDVTNDLFYLCLDSTVGAAIWRRFEPYDADLEAIAALTSAADKLPYATGANTWALTTLTSYARTLLDDPDAATARSTLGLVIGTNVQAYDAGLANLASFNTNGFLVQTADNTFAGRTLGGTAGEITVTNGSGVAGNPVLSLPSSLTFTGKTITGGDYTSAVGLSFNTAAGTATRVKFSNDSGLRRWELGKDGDTEAGANSGSSFYLDRYNDAGVFIDTPVYINRSTGSIAISTPVSFGTSAVTGSNVTITGGAISGITDLAIADGGTGASTAANARTNLGLGTIATQASSAVSITGGSITGITDLTVADGGTGVSTITGIIKGNGAAAFSAATQGVDYYDPGGTDVAVADGGTGVSSTTAYAVQCGGTTSTGPHQAIASVGSAGQLLTSNGAGALPSMQTLSSSTVGTATAGLSVGAVGTYAMLLDSVVRATTAGTTRAGADLYYCSADGNNGANSPAGTWMCCGETQSGGGFPNRVTMWLRVS